MSGRDLEKAALRGEASYLWRAGQVRRFELMKAAAGDRIAGRVLDDGCGVGTYLAHLAPLARSAFGLEYDSARARQASQLSTNISRGASERLPFPNDSFDLVLSHEVLEHVEDDRSAAHEAIRVLRPGGRLLLFVPNRWYPVETHGVFWRGQYHFGNIPLVNYLPPQLRDHLTPHVRAYRRSDVAALFADLPVRVIERTVIFGAYDNLIARWPILGRVIRTVLHSLEGTPFGILGLSHFWVVEKRSIA